MTITTTRSVPSSAMQPIRDLDAQINTLIAKKRTAIAQVINDFEWMDIPTMIVREGSIDAASRNAETLHVLHQTDERDGRVMVRCHAPSDCPADGYWCHHGGARRTRARHGRGFQHSFAGTYRVFARLDGDLYLAATGGE